MSRARAGKGISCVQVEEQSSGDCVWLLTALWVSMQRKNHLRHVVWFHDDV